MKKLTYITLLIAGLLSNSCTSDFEEMNKSKTASTSISPDYVFTKSLVTGSGVSYQIYQLNQEITAGAWVQHWANIASSFRADNYKPSYEDNIYDFYFARANFAPLSLNHQVIKLIQEGDNNPLKLACAKIWNVYLFHLMTDSYGDIPYSEAFLSSTPKFDAQKSIYEDMLKTLDQSITSIKQNNNTETLKRFPAFGNADVLYKGNLNNWVKFANSLMLRLSMRVSNVDANLSKQYISKINPNELVLNNSENAIIVAIKASAAATNEIKNPLGFIYSWNEIRISKNLMDHLDGTNYGGVVDPRIKQFAQTINAGAGTTYKGLLNGQNAQNLAANATDFKNNYSNVGPFFNTQAYDTPIFLLTAAETNFLLAEAALKGFITGTSQTYYENGIKSSMEQFKNSLTNTPVIADQEITDYMNATGVKFETSNALKQIITQKWISLYSNPVEAWAEMRRTGFPKINPLVENEPGYTEMPRRRSFSTAEIKYNLANYNAAVAKMGGDGQYTKIWWDGGK